MKQTIIFLGLLSSASAFSQVGINNQLPKATLDIIAKATDGSTAEGILAPRITGDALHAADTGGKYGATQDGALIYVTAVPSASNQTGQTSQMSSTGYYYFDAAANKWQKVGAGSTAASVYNKPNIVSGTYTLLPTDGYVTIDQNAVGPTVTLNLSDSQPYTTGQVFYISNLSFNNVQLNFTFNGSPSNNFISVTNLPYLPAGFQGILIYRGGLSSTAGSWGLITSNL